MATIATKASVLAIMEETLEGKPVAPIASTDYTALQDDAAMAPAFNVLENAEFKNSIGKSKPILGTENPTFRMSHYLRASGVAGTSPDYGLFLKGAFGTETIRNTFDSLAGGSTVSLLNLQAGEGTEYTKGSSFLLQDNTGGLYVRTAESVTGDSIVPSFDLPETPSSWNITPAVDYKTADADQVSLTIWQFLGNGGAIQMTSGSKVTAFTFDATAGELINSNYSLEALEYYFDPVTIDATNNILDWDDDGIVRAATVVEGTYKDPLQFAAAVQNAMVASSGSAPTCVYVSTTGKFTLATTQSVMELLWATGANTATTIGTKLGFDVASDDTGAVTYDSDNAIDLSAPQAPVFDTADPVAAKDHQVMLGTASDNLCFHASSISFSLANTKSTPGDICAVSGNGPSIISERFVDVTVVALLNQYDAINFKRFRSGDEVKFQYTFGSKVNSQWVSGDTGTLYLGSTTIVEYTIDDSDGLSQLTLKLQAFVNDAGDGEAFLGFV